jgi:hypothetical protein
MPPRPDGLRTAAMPRQRQAALAAVSRGVQTIKQDERASALQAEVARLTICSRVVHGLPGTTGPGSPSVRA